MNPASESTTSSSRTVKILSGGEKRSDDQIMAAHDRRVRRVSGPGLPGAEDSPLVVMELLQRLRVKDVMRGHDIISVVRTDSMRFAQNLMKRNHISGVPVWKTDGSSAWSR